MRRASNIATAAAMLAFAATPPVAHAQNTADPAAIERGRSAYSSSCAFCHGSQAMGTEQAPNLARSPIVRSDVNGDALIPFIKAGRPQLGMPSFASLPQSQIADIAAFLHSRAALARGHRDSESSLLVGDPKQGEAYFKGAGGCSGCHSVTGDLAHIGSKYSPLAMTTAFLTPAAQPVKAKITLPSGESVSGTVDYVDEFTIAITDSSGEHRSWSRDLTRSVEIIDPLAAHESLLAKYTDADIHNLLVYLVSLK